MEPSPTEPNLLFQHSPLMTDGSTFRVVRIFPGAYDDPIHCDFLEVPISAQPNYSALSYTWGSAGITEYAQCRGYATGVGNSLEKALRRIRSPLELCGFWIDALCIDQRDDAGEKTTQIPLMRRIYQQASKVTIYLGEEQDGSEKIPLLCDGIRQAFSMVPQPPERKSLHVKSFADWYSLPQIDLTDDELFHFDLPRRNSGEWKVFAQFFSRPWFFRVWILQEAVLSTSTEILCGSWALGWNELIHVILASQLLGIYLVPNEIVRGGIQVSDYETPQRAVNQILFMEALGARRKDFMRWKCIDLLDSTRACLTTMPHDYCYGLLGIAKELGHPDLQVDYTLPVEEVYCQFARFFVRSGDGISVLYHASWHRLELPSWVPDWSYKFVKRPPELTGTDNLRREGAPAAATLYPSSIKLHTELPNVLIVRGLVVDHIDSIGSCHLSTLSLDKNQNGLPSRSKLPATPPILDDELHQLVAACIVELSHFIHDEPSPVYAPTEHEETIIWKTLTYGFQHRPIGKDAPSPMDLYRQFLLLLMSLVSGWFLPQMLDTDLQDLMLRSDRDDMLNHGGKFLKEIYDNCYDRRRGRTWCGYVGQFSYLSQVGDLVFLPLGSPLPFTIRPRGDGTFELLGECYVHGIMNGEAFDLKGVVEEDILLS